MAALFALTQPGETMTCTSLDHGAHISTAKFGAVGFRGVNTVTYPFDTQDMVIDVDGAAQAHPLRAEPKVAQFGLSVFLFPAPLKELQETLRRGRLHRSGTTARTSSVSSPAASSRTPCTKARTSSPPVDPQDLPRPQPRHRPRSQPHEELEKKLNSAVFPGVTSSHHLHAMAALAVTMAEWEIYGKKYAAQVCKNAKALGQALHELGMDVLCSHKGFTESHTIAVNVAAARRRRQASIDL